MKRSVMYSSNQILPKFEKQFLTKVFSSIFLSVILIGTTATAETLPQAEYGTGDTTIHYDWQMDTTTNGYKLIKNVNGDITIKYDSSAPDLTPLTNNEDKSTENIIGKYIEKNSQLLNNQSGGKIGIFDATIIDSTITGNRFLYNSSNATINELKGIYSGNTTIVNGNNQGVVIRNDGEITTINANFIANTCISSSTNGQSYGGVIINTNTIKTIKGDFVGNYVQGVGRMTNDNLGYGMYGGAIHNTGTIETIESNFISNHADSTVAMSVGGAINNENSIGDITSNFINNYTTSSGAWASGGAIYNNENISIGNITGNFINNYSVSTGTLSSSSGEAGAIFNNGTISNITGDFAENYATSKNASSIGGAITNNKTGSINNIKGNFTNNYINSSGTYAYGGAIYNIGTINDIEGDFTTNSATTTGINNALGGAITNGGSIHDIKGNFTNNYISSNGTSASGGAIYNRSNINDINGNFINNYATTSGTYAYGGAIYNIGTINDIEGDFTTNSATTTGINNALGGAITNGGSIHDIKGNFTNNYISSNGTSASGGAIYNRGTINDITGDFTNNYVTSSGTGNAGGAGIFNSNGTIGDIKGNFDNNYSIASGSSNAAGGSAIYNVGGSIGNIIGNFTNNSANTYNGNIAGGIIYNNNIIKSISGNFINNSSFAGTYIFGSVIFNMGTIDSISGSFVNNSAKTTSSTYLALGGAIFIHRLDTRLVADNITNIFSGNYTEDYRGKINNAIFVRTNQISSGVETIYNPIITFNTTNNGKFIINDTIDGGEINEDFTQLTREHQYNIEMTGDSTGEIYINNKIYNANISQSNITSYVNNASDLNNGNSIAITSGIMNINHFGMTQLNLKSFANNGTINIASVDINPATKEMGKIVGESYGSQTGTININGLNVLADPTAVKTNVAFADTEFANTVKYNGSNQYLGKVYKYSVNYLPDTGEFEFLRSGGSSSGSYNSFNPATLATPVNNQAVSSATITESFKYVFEHTDTFTKLPKFERMARIKSTQYAISTDFNENLAPLSMNFDNKAGWFRPYVTFENMNLRHGPKVNAITYGSLAGYDGNFVTMKHGWTRLGSGYIGYNGSQLSYKGVDTSMNGGLLGLTETFYKGNFWTSLTLSAGASVGENSTMFGKEDFTTLLAGIGSKTGYNFEFQEGRYIIQPIWFMSYTFAKTFDYTNAANVRINSDPTHSIQLNPCIRFVVNTKNRWQPYISIGMVWNLMNSGTVTANGVRLPEMGMKPYVEYGLGVQKLYKDRCTAFCQAMIRNGGRNGVALTFGFRWELGKNQKHIERVQKTNKTIIGNAINKQIKTTLSCIK